MPASLTRSSAVSHITVFVFTFFLLLHSSTTTLAWRQRQPFFGLISRTTSTSSTTSRRTFLIPPPASSHYRHRLATTTTPSMSSSSSTTTPPPHPSPLADKKEIKRVYAYAHGFLSDENSFKGRFFRDFFSKHGPTTLHLLNLNPQDTQGKNDYASITYTGALQAIQNLYEAEGGAQANVKLTLFGSSLGGYVAARYAELHPEAVEKMVLFCPGFNLQGRWPSLFGEEGMKMWKEKGSREFEVKGQKVQVPYGFLEDGYRHPPFPNFVQPALVIHGLRDETVPVETTTEDLLGQGERVKELVHVLLVDDDHGLTKEKTLAVASKCILEFLDIREEHKDKEEKEEKETNKLTASDHIEVEQKFSVHDRAALENKLLAAGAELKGAVIFTDIYFDLPGHLLSLGNVFLRQRSGIWEAKIPAISGEHPNTATVSCYREITGQEDIATWLRAAFPTELGALEPSLPLPELLRVAGVYPMAKYQTHRSKYTILVKEKGSKDNQPPVVLNLDLDEASYGYTILEIEDLVATAEGINDAKARILFCAREMLGLGGVDDVIRGKLEEYLLREKPSHHARLVKEGVFKA